METKSCTRCHVIKNLDEFHRFNASRDGHRSECKSCACNRAKDSYVSHGDGEITIVCEWCSNLFTYFKTSGPKRKYCSQDCKYRGTEQLKKDRSPKVTRKCEHCGSSKVSVYGRPVCSNCKSDKRDPDKQRIKERARSLSKYGLTIEQFDNMLANQCGRCASCGSDSSGVTGRVNLHVDHDHRTGKVRGLLCHLCNVSLPDVDNPIERLLGLIEYLKRHEVKV